MNVCQFSVFFFRILCHPQDYQGFRQDQRFETRGKLRLLSWPENSHRMNIHNKDLQFGTQHMLQIYHYTLYIYTHTYTSRNASSWYLGFVSFLLTGTLAEMERRNMSGQKHQADAAFADLTRASGVPLGGPSSHINRHEFVELDAVIQNHREEPDQVTLKTTCSHCLRNWFWWHVKMWEAQD